MCGNRSATRGALLALLVLASPAVVAQEAPQRLSRFLLERPAAQEAYPLGLSWRVPSEEAAQQLLRHELLNDLSAQPSLRNLYEAVRALPITGRVPVASGDARWLLGHPSR